MKGAPSRPLVGRPSGYPAARPRIPRSRKLCGTIEPAAPNNGQANDNGGGGGSLLTFASRMMLIYLVITAFGPQSPQKIDTSQQTADPTASETSAAPAQVASGEKKDAAKPPPADQRPHRNLWQEHEPFDMYVFVNENEKLKTKETSKANAVWIEKGLTYDAQESNYRSYNYTFEPSEHVKNNGSLYFHIFLVKPHVKEFKTTISKDIVYTRGELVKYKLKKKTVALKNLLGGDTSDGSPDEDASLEPDKAVAMAEEPTASDDAGTIVSYMKPRLDAAVVLDHMVLPAGSIMPHIRKYYKIHPQTNAYLPPLMASDFWVLENNLIEMNDTVNSVTIELTFNTRSRMMFEMEVQMVMSWDHQDNMGMASGRDVIKEMLLDTNPYLLALTAAVSLLHSVFDFLAFKNDIQFWRKKETMEGLSVRSILLNVFCQGVIFLYLLDNDTSWIILISSGVGLLIEMWKVKKAMNVKVVTVASSIFPYRLQLQDKESYKSETKKHDETAMRYLSYVMYPCVVGYSIYSLVYQSHKSWYSWILGSLVGTVYMFGFIMMTPQLFINYKLKSVAHLPWRVFVYKALNTFVDDLFAFIIKMPTMHRLACFRDDLIFFIFLYQRWIYRVDMSRANEFGQVFEDPDKEDKDEKSEPTTKDGAEPSADHSANEPAKDPVLKKEE